MEKKRSRRHRYLRKLMTIKNLLLSVLTIFLIESNVTLDEKTKSIIWVNSLECGTYFNSDESSTIIKKKSKGNITIESIYQNSFCIMEFDSLGSLVSATTGKIVTSK